MRLLKNEDLASLDPGSWFQMAAEQMTAALGEKNSPFPCTFGIAGYATNQLRYCFIEGAADTDGATTQVAAALQSYLVPDRKHAKSNNDAGSRRFYQNEDFLKPAF